MNNRNLGLKRGALMLIGISLILSVSSSLVYAQWSVVTPPAVSADWELSGIQLISTAEGWAVGRDSGNKEGVILHFLNRSWSPVTVPDVSADWNLLSVSFPVSTEGWAVGTDLANNKGIILHFTNGSWVSVTPPDVGSLDWELSGVDFPTQSEGWAVGTDLANKKGIILHFTNKSWTVTTPPSVSTNWQLSNLSFSTTAEGWAVGTDPTDREGVILHFFASTSWTSVSPPTVSTNWGLSDLQVMASREGWAVGTDSANKKGVLLHFSNGVWTSTTPPDVSTNWEISSVSFAPGTSSDGWAVGRDILNSEGVILHFSNKSWTLIPPPEDTSVIPPTEISSNWELRDVYFAASDYGWAVGKDSANQKGILLNYAIPEISVSGTKAFGTVPIGAIKDQQVTVRSIGSANLIIGSVAPPSGPFSLKQDNCSGKTLLPKTSCKIVVRFAPSSEGDFASSLGIPSNDPQKPEVDVALSGTSSGQTFIHLVSPTDGQGFTACSFYDRPTFQWDPNPNERFKSLQVWFSAAADFVTLPVVKASGKPGTSALLISPSLWKKALLLPGASGGTVYWMVVGNTKDYTVESNVFSFIVAQPEPVSNPQISSTSRTASPPPTLSWENKCNVKFKVRFGNDADFKKKVILNFSVKNPTDNGGLFSKTLTVGQWKSIRKLVGDVVGSTIFWDIESRDALNRSVKIEPPMSFVLTD